MARAKILGYGVYCCDADDNCPGMRWAKKYGKFRAVASTYDADAIIDALGSRHIDGVLAIGADVGPVVSRVAAHYNLPHIPLETSQLSWDKQALRRRLRAGGVNVPDGMLIPAGRVVALFPWEKWGAAVVKPVGGRGAAGVRIVENDKQLAAAMDIAKGLARDGEVIIEKYLPGPQVSAEAVFYNGHMILCGMSDRDYREQTKPLFMEFGGWCPSEVSDSIGWKINETVEKTGKILGIASGTIKLDIVIKDGTPYVLEAAIGRIGGGYNVLYWELCYGCQFSAAILALACGDDPRPHFPFVRADKLFHCRGIYKDAATATSHRERGKFYLALGHTALEAAEKAMRKEQEWLNS